MPKNVKQFFDSYGRNQSVAQLEVALYLIVCERVRFCGLSSRDPVEIWKPV